jgi:hypothetical protein
LAFIGFSYHASAATVSETSMYDDDDDDDDDDEDDYHNDDAGGGRDEDDEDHDHDGGSDDGNDDIVTLTSPHDVHRCRSSEAAADLKTKQQLESAVSDNIGLQGQIAALKAEQTVLVRCDKASNQQE